MNPQQQFLHFLLVATPVLMMMTMWSFATIVGVQNVARTIYKTKPPAHIHPFFPTNPGWLSQPTATPKPNKPKPIIIIPPQTPPFVSAQKNVLPPLLQSHKPPMSIPTRTRLICYQVHLRYV